MAADAVFPRKAMNHVLPSGGSDAVSHKIGSYFMMKPGIGWQYCLAWTEEHFRSMNIS